MLTPAIVKINRHTADTIATLKPSEYVNEVIRQTKGITHESGETLANQKLAEIKDKLMIEEPSYLYVYVKHAIN